MEHKLKQFSYYSMLALLVYMPFHVFLSQSLSLLTGGLDVWKIAKDIFTLLLVAVVLVLAWKKHKTNPNPKALLVLAIVYGLVHAVIWLIHPDVFFKSALLSVIYDNRLIWYLLIGFGVALLLKDKINTNKFAKIAVIISTVVCLLGIAQYFLPKDLLTHFGYSFPRGARSAFFIDDKPNLPRIMSTLRDPNSLGAYLILPITIIVYYLLNKLKDNKKRLLLSMILIIHLVALFLTFSRSAWIGALVSVGFLLVYCFRQETKTFIRKTWPFFIALFLIMGVATYSFWQHHAVRNIIVHSDDSTTLPSSNLKHFRYATETAQDIEDNPIGHGLGKSGLVSIHNPTGGKLPENYYLVIGYNLGVIGLLVFIGINLWVYLRLKSKDMLTHCLLASFWGYIVTNMLLQTWTNEAVAAQWWLLAGICVGVATIKHSTTTNKSIKPSNKPQTH